MLLRNGAVYIAARILPGALGFATTVLLTWYLPPDAYGTYGFYMAMVCLGSNVLFDWLGQSLLRWFETHGRDSVFVSTVLSIFGAICAGSALLLGLVTALGLLDGYAGEAWLILAGIWAYAWFELAACFQIGTFRPWRYLVMNAARNLGILAGGVALASLTHAAQPVLMASFLAMAVSGCLFAADGSMQWRPIIDRGLARSLVAYGAPIGLTMVLFSLITTINRLALGTLSSAAAVGAFTIGSALVQSSMSMLATGLSAASYPAAVRAVESGNAAAARAQLGRNCSAVLAVLLPAGAGLALLAPRVAGLLVSPRYHEAVILTAPWLAAASVLLGVRATYVDTAFQLGKRPWMLVQVMVVGAAANIVCDLVLIPPFDYVGACMAAFVASGLALAHAALLAPRAYPLPFPREETARIVLATGAMTVSLVATKSWPGVAGLMAAVCISFAIYATMVLALNVLGLRDGVRERWTMIAARSIPKPRLPSR